MKTSRKISLLCLVVLASVTLSRSIFACPAGEGKEPVDRATMIQRHEAMATMHKNMVKCLKSKQSDDACYAQMKKEMPAMKEGHCPMMDEKDMGHCGAMQEKPAK